MADKGAGRNLVPDASADGSVDRPDAGAVPPHRHPAHRHHHRSPVTTLVLLLIAIGAVAATSFAVLWVYGPGSSPGASSPTNLNPGNVPVLAVRGSLSYSGNSSGYLSIVEGANLCARCPVVPSTNNQFTPPVAGFSFYFNVTNLGSVYHTLGAFSIASPAYGGMPIFRLGAVFCCGPTYQETTESVGLVPGQTMALMVFLEAASIPEAGAPGFTLDFFAVSSD